MCINSQSRLFMTYIHYVMFADIVRQFLSILVLYWLTSECSEIYMKSTCVLSEIKQQR